VLLENGSKRHGGGYGFGCHHSTNAEALQQDVIGPYGSFRSSLWLQLFFLLLIFFNLIIICLITSDDLQLLTLKEAPQDRADHIQEAVAFIFVATRESTGTGV